MFGGKMKPNIHMIKAKESLVLNLDGNLIEPRKPVWEISEETGLKGISRPAAFYRAKVAVLEVTLSIPRAKKGDKFKLECRNSARSLLFSGEIVLNSDVQKVRFELQARFQPEGFFQVNGESLNWYLYKNDRKTLGPAPVPFELFWLLEENYSFFKRGIPVEILREISKKPEVCEELNLYPEKLVGRFKNLVRDFFGKSAPDVAYLPKAELVKEIVNACFYIKPLRYDIYGKKTERFITGDRDNYTLLTCKYFEARENEEYVCNCFEQAALLQCFLKAFGIRDVEYCELSPFGYIGETYLVGREGLCNNPIYKGDFSLMNLKGEDRKKDSRTCFHRHAFCRLLMEGKEKIVDACIGPEIGDNNAKDYLSKTLDKVNPRPFYKGNEDIILSYNGVTHLDWLVPIKKQKKTEMLEKFIGLGRWPNIVDLDLGMEVVVCRWPEPCLSSIISKSEWEPFKICGEVIPGTGEAMRTWMLRKLSEPDKTVTIDVYVSSIGSEVAFNRFLWLNSFYCYNDPERKMKKHQTGGYYSKFSAEDDWGYFRVYRNVVFEVSCRNNALDIDNIVEWLNEYISSDKYCKKTLSEDLPFLRYEIFTYNKDIKVGETIIIKMEASKNAMCDFELQGDGVRLVKEEENSLVFTAQKKSKNTLTLAAVDKETLLVRNEVIKINVGGVESPEN
jgi:hypothetical protein